MELIVKQVPQKDAGKGLVFIDRGDFSELGIQEGDYVAIKGRDPPKNPVVGKVFPGYANDLGQKVIRMDVKSLGGDQLFNVTVEFTKLFGKRFLNRRKAKPGFGIQVESGHSKRDREALPFPLGSAQ